MLIRFVSRDFTVGCRSNATHNPRNSVSSARYPLVWYSVRKLADETEFSPRKPLPWATTHWPYRPATVQTRTESRNAFTVQPKSVRKSIILIKKGWWKFSWARSRLVEPENVTISLHADWSGSVLAVVWTRLWSHLFRPAARHIDSSPTNCG